MEARAAATVLLLRDGAAGLEVFMVVRHQAMRFAAGALVFPGGAVDAGDEAIAGDAAVCPGGAAVRVAAIRETFEECGVLLAREGARVVPGGRLPTLAAAMRDRGFGAMLREAGLLLAPDLLVPFAHWITPVQQPRRFDTLFLLAPMPDDQVGAHDGAESVDSAWLGPGAALLAAEAGTYRLVFPTQMNLRKLSRFGSVAEAMAAARGAAVVTVMPELVRSLGGHRRELRIPLEAGYGGEVFDVDLPPG